MRVQGAAVCLVAVMLLVGCSPQPPKPPTANLTLGTPVPAATAGPEASGAAEPEDPAPIDTDALLGVGQPLNVPADPKAAATYLADAVRNPATSTAAVRELLLRSGIGIFRTDTGALAAMPADPSFVDSYLYEFEVPLLAGGVASGTVTSLQPALDLALALGMVPPDTDLAWMDALLARWLDASSANPTGAMAFGGLATRALMAAGDAATGADGAAHLDPLAFQLFLTSMLSRLGHFAPSTGGGTIVQAAVRPTPADTDTGPARDLCNEPGGDEGSGVPAKLGEETVTWIGQQMLGEKWLKWLGRAYDAGQLLTTAQARYALLSGLQITVTSDAKDTPHYRHDRNPGSGADVWQFTAKAEFRTDLGGRIVACGPLAGLRIPANQGIEGMKLQWSLSDNLECSAASGNCAKLGRGGGGGDTTDANGESALEVQTKVEDGCPNNDDVCAKGERVTTTSWARVTPDVTSKPPIDIGDLLMNPGEVPVEVLKALLKVLTDVVTDIASSAKAASGTQTVAYHKTLDYRVEFTTGITLSGTKCDGFIGPWSLKFSGHPDASTTVKGTLTFTLDEDGRGRASYNLTITVKVKAGGKVIKAEVEDRGTADVELVNPGGAAVLEVTGIEGKGAASGSGPGMTFKKMFFEGDGGQVGIPVERGDLCGS